MHVQYCSQESYKKTCTRKIISSLVTHMDVSAQWFKTIADQDIFKLLYTNILVCILIYNEVIKLM